MTTTDKEFRVVQFLNPSHSRHSGAIADINTALVRFQDAIEAAKSDTTVKRVALYRYTATKTECMDDWNRLGGRACKLRHENPSIAITPAQAA